MSHRKRKAVRVPVPQERAPATLRVGESRIAAELIDESATGFGAAVSAADAGLLHKDQTVLIGTETGWFEGRIANTSAFDGLVVVGIERLRELTETWEESPPTTGAWTLRSTSPRRMGSSLRGYAVLLALVMICASALRPGIFWPERAEEQAPARRQSAARQGLGDALGQYAQAVSVEEGDGIAPVADGWTPQGKRNSGSAAGVIDRGAQVVADAAEASGAAIADVADPVVAAAESLLASAPAWMNNLNLSTEQRNRISQIVEDAGKSIGEAYRRAEQSGQDVSAEVAELRRSAAAAVLRELSPEQTRQVQIQQGP